MIHWMGLPLLMLFLMASPALAQKSNVVTVEKSDGEDTVVIRIEDGERTVTVNGEVLSDEEAEKYLKEKDMVWVGDDEHVFRVGPKGNRFRFFGDEDGEFMTRFRKEMDENGPQTYFFKRDGTGDNTFFLEDGLHGLRDGLAFFGEGNEFVFGSGASMTERAEIAKMDMESRRLAMKVKQAEDDAERARLESELQTLLADIFERKESLREERIEALRSQIDEATAARQDRLQNRQEIIERRMKELLGERDKYDW
jgi:hypothetical protein